VTDREDVTTERLLAELRAAIEDFDDILTEPDPRARVLALVPAANLMSELGKSLVTPGLAASARDRILAYLRRYPATVIASEELAVVSGISEYARRIRELRKEHGWPIYSGITISELASEEVWEAAEGHALEPEELQGMAPDDYILLGEQDRDAAHRWSIANEIRKRTDLSLRDRLLAYLRANVGHPVTGEELRYVANGKQSWPRRTRELRTEYGWPLSTRMSGRPDLPLGAYLLEEDRQLPVHDRNIPDSVRVEVLERDGFACVCCGWSPNRRTEGDPRTLLELHHIEHHVERGPNRAANLVTLCNVHHDKLHREDVRGREAFKRWLSRCQG